MPERAALLVWSAAPAPCSHTLQHTRLLCGPTCRQLRRRGGRLRRFLIPPGPPSAANKRKHRCRICCSGAPRAQQAKRRPPLARAWWRARRCNPGIIAALPLPAGRARSRRQHLRKGGRGRRIARHRCRHARRRPPRQRAMDSVLSRPFRSRPPPLTAVEERVKVRTSCTNQPANGWNL